VREALATMRNLSGVLVDDEARWRFALRAEGDLWLAGPGPDEWIAYDAGAGVVRSAQRSASLGGGPVFYAERRGVAPGPPDERAPLPREYGAYVRALLAADDPRVRETVDAWRVEVEIVADEFSGDSLEITVDRQTGMPVRIVERKGEAVLRTVRIEGLRVNVDLPAGTFRPAFPEGAEVMRSDDGFQRGAPAAPLTAAWVPAGYALAQAAVNRERRIVSLSYRRGLDQFLVTTRPREAAEPVTGEPVGLGSGALAGEDAQLVLAPRSLPHLWARTDSLVVIVGGDLSRAELVRVAESLRSP
jgi:hypothetical protein